MMGLGYLMEEAACLVKRVCHGASTARRTQREPASIQDPSYPACPGCKRRLHFRHNSTNPLLVIR